MARGKVTLKRKKVQADSKHQSVDVSRFINKVMLDGKKTIAENLVYSALTIAATKLKKTEIEIFNEVIKEASPLIEVRSKRIGGAAYQVPTPVSDKRGKHLAMVWLINATRARKGQTFDKKLAAEMVDLLNGAGGTFKKKEDTHKMAEANKALAYLAKMR
jgi:small subunit ribosomal protein S7